MELKPGVEFITDTSCSGSLNESPAISGLVEGLETLPDKCQN